MPTQIDTPAPDATTPEVKTSLASAPKATPPKPAVAARKPAEKPAAKPAAKAADKPVTQPVAKPVVKVIGKTAPKAAPKTLPAKKTVAATPADKSAKKPAKQTEPRKSDTKPLKIKMIRDSFTFPEADHSQRATLKKRVVALGQDVKKGELVRAGIALLTNMDDKALLAAVDKVDRLKTGRPKKQCGGACAPSRQRHHLCDSPPG